MAVRTFFMVETKLFSIRSKLFVVTVLLACSSGLVGCPEGQNKEASPTVGGEESRPPLRVLMIGCPDLSEALQLRWRSASQQSLSLEPISIDEFQERRSFSADVVIYPAYLLGDVIGRGIVSPTPKRLMLEGSTTQYMNTSWPPHWNHVASYGKKHWGIVLGAPLPVVVQSQQTSLQSFQLSELIRKTTEASAIRSSNSSDAPISDDSLLSNYLLMIACTKKDAAATGSFFHLSDMRSRLTEKEYRQAAELLIQLHEQLPGGVGIEAVEAWQDVLREAKPWSIGRPGPASTSPEITASPDGIQVGFVNAPNDGIHSATNTSTSVNDVGTTVDVGLGLMVSVGAMSRQSSASTFFLEWIDDDEQRLALGRITELVVPAKTENNLLTGPDAQYDRCCRKAWAHGAPMLELRLSGGIQYRRRLVQAIRSFLENPQRIDEELRKCGEDWDKITIAMGRDRQRNSAEQSYLLSD